MLERNASCYSGTRTEGGTSFSKLEVQYSDKRTLEQELRALGSGFKIAPTNIGDVKLVLTNLSIAKTTGVFDPLSSCKAGTHQVIVWELRAGEATLVGSDESVRSVTTSVDAGPIDLKSKLDVQDNESFKIVATNIVFAYLTLKLETSEWTDKSTWTGEIRPDSPVRLPSPPGIEDGLSLKVLSFDRRPGAGFKFRLSGRHAMSATCGAGAPAPALDLTMGIGDSCSVTINDATLLLIRTSFANGEIDVSSTLVRTLRVEPPQ